MKAHELYCLGASYLSVRREYVEEVVGQKWTAEELRGLMPGWVVEGANVVIRRVRKK